VNDSVTDAHRASIERHLRSLATSAEAAANAVCAETAAVADLVIRTLNAGGKLLFCGNGGSAADAQHLATEYVVRFRQNRTPLSAIALTTDTSLLTAAANDFGFEQVFARQVAALGRPGDVLFLHTTSGESANLVAAAHAARIARVVTVGMLARGGGRLRALVDHAIVLPTADGAHAQELQLALGHAICDIVDAHFAAAASPPTPALDADTVQLLHAARLEEKKQALFYRALAAAAEEIDDAALSERLNGLHADEQHHLSRLTVRLVELGEAVSDMGSERAPSVSLAGWEDVARARERQELERYDALLARALDDKTAHMIRQFADAERGHAELLGGKWMNAEPW
jgi:D-sedoheptulose 7-phosphate isomerase